MPSTIRSLGIPALFALATATTFGANATLPSSSDAYLSQAARVRQSVDRPWAPDAGQLGNLRHLQIVAPDCVVRVVSGAENRVLPGTRDVRVFERSRVLDADPNERPTPRDVVLAIDHAQACRDAGSCGTSIASLARAPNGDAGSACFTVQLATAHDLLLGGDGLSLLVDRVRQPVLRVALNPSYRLRVWFEEVDVGLLSIRANAPARVGGSGRVDFLQADSSNGASVMLLHEMEARHVGVSATTTGTQWSIRIGPETKAGYYQPARAPGALAARYSIEIDGPIERLDVPAGSVEARPLSDATRDAARALRDYVVEHAGRAPALPISDPTLPSADVAAAALPRDARQRVADVVARYLPASIRITGIALWKQGGRLEGVAPDAATARDVVRQLTASGEFTYVSGGASGTPRDGGYAFSTQLHFSCDAPGEPSVCPAGDPAAGGAYSSAQVRRALEAALGATVTVHDVSLDGDTIKLKAAAPNETEARAALERVRQSTAGLFRPSISGYGPPGGPTTPVDATLKLVCRVPPRADGICMPRDGSR